MVVKSDEWEGETVYRDYCVHACEFETERQRGWLNGNGEVVAAG